MSLFVCLPEGNTLDIWQQKYAWEKIYGNLWEKNLGTNKSKNRREKNWEIYGTLRTKWEMGTRIWNQQWVNYKLILNDEMVSKMVCA